MPKMEITLIRKEHDSQMALGEDRNMLEYRKGKSYNNSPWRSQSYIHLPRMRYTKSSLPCRTSQRSMLFDLPDIPIEDVPRTGILMRRKQLGCSMQLVIHVGLDQKLMVLDEAGINLFAKRTRV